MSVDTDTLAFYDQMISFKNFSEFTDPKYFDDIPESWCIIITDIKGSTKAIESGRYQDVNMIGAASVSVVQEVLDEDFPFVFGGDGATLVIPNKHKPEVFDALCGLRRLSQEQFDLGLRVGCVSVKEVYEKEGKLEVAKHELSASKCIAIFRGGGLSIAEDLIKGNEEQYEIEDRKMPPATLGGLSCNWKPIENKRGHMMSLLLLSCNDDPKVYQDFLSKLDEIYGGDSGQGNPVNIEKLQLKSFSTVVGEAFRIVPNFFSGLFFRRVYFSTLILLSKWIPIPHLGTHKSGKMGEYLPTMREHADHRKFDDMLRMVLDCSKEQVAEIQKYLDEEYEKGNLFYGTYLSEKALMTCYVANMAPGQHIHFIDGGDGGYAMAAKQLKGQIKKSKQSI